MVVSGKQAKWLFPLVAVFLLVTASAAPAAEPTAKPAAPDGVKKRLAREQAILLRTVEDLDKSLAYVMETISALEEQTGTTAVLEPNKMRNDFGDVRDWYEKYAGWLGGMAAEFETDLAEHFSRREASAGWTGRYEDMTKGYQGLAGQLAGKVRELEAAQSRIEVRMQKLKQAVQERRLLVEKDDLELAKELWPTYRDSPYPHREAVYKDLTEDEVGRFGYELMMLGEEKKHFEVLTELGRHELSWLSLKIEDSAALSTVARAIADDAPGAIQNACRGVLRTYESDIAIFKRKVDEIDRKLSAITRTGTMKTLDLFEDLSDSYEKMKNRYERHIDWLRAQIGSYRADLVELAREI